MISAIVAGAKNIFCGMDDIFKKKSSIQTEYLYRINHVVDYIEAHLDETLTLETLSHIACFSKFHFHRIFLAVTGERLAECIQRLRLEKAAVLLHNNLQMAITDIGLRCGFASSASFANAFKRYYGKSASEYRCSEKNVTQKRYICLPDENRNTLHIRIEQQEGKLSYHIRGIGYQRQVDVVELPPWHVAYIRYTGSYKGDTRLFARLWNRLAAWAAPLGLLKNPDTVFLTLCHDDPEITLEEKLRISVCISVDENTKTTGEVGKMQLPGGKYAVCRFVLGPQDYPEAWGWIYGTFLPLSGYQVDDRIAFEWFIPQNQQNAGERNSIDICIPVK
ncbi:MAG: AraC family transcriptional regulator [Chitinispirillaceae bacterium]|nr:AraC family transcriptional regulator [Chitinispirillaceae bacterium]